MICYDFWELKYKKGFFFLDTLKRSGCVQKRNYMSGRIKMKQQTIVMVSFLHFYLFLMVSISFNSFAIYGVLNENKQKKMIKCKNMHPFGWKERGAVGISSAQSASRFICLFKVITNIFSQVVLLLPSYPRRPLVAGWLLLQFIHFYLNNLSISFYFAHNISIK